MFYCDTKLTATFSLPRAQSAQVGIAASTTVLITDGEGDDALHGLKQYLV